MSDETIAVTNNRFKNFNRRKKSCKNVPRKKTPITCNSTAGLKGSTDDLDSYLLLVSEDVKGMRKDQFSVTNEQCKPPKT